VAKEFGEYTSIKAPSVFLLYDFRRIAKQKLLIAIGNTTGDANAIQKLRIATQEA
jgi:hypothetical protein